MSKILIVNQNYNMGGIRKTLDVFVKELCRYYDIDIQFLEFPIVSPVFPSNVRILPSLFLIDTFKTPLWNLKKKNNYVMRYMVKGMLKMISKLWGNEHTTYFILNHSRKLKERYAAVIVYSHDLHIPGAYNGGANYFATNNVNAKVKLSWIHGELSTIGLDESSIKQDYSQMDYVVNVSKIMKKRFDELSKGITKSIYIRNMYDFQDIIVKSQENTDIDTGGKFTILSIARLDSPVKRVDRIIEIGKCLKERGLDYLWIVIGGGQKLGEYRKDCLENGLKDEIHYLGENNNPYKYLNCADVLVITSDSEAYPTTIVEAQTLKVPVITTDYPAASELINNGYDGIIVGKNIDDLTNAIIELANNHELYTRLRHNCYHLCNNQDSINKVLSLCEQATPDFRDRSGNNSVIGKD